jgi:hypothetical protein
MIELHINKVLKKATLISEEPRYISKERLKELFDTQIITIELNGDGVKGEMQLSLNPQVPSRLDIKLWIGEM